MPDNLRETVKEICDERKINQSEFIRYSLIQGIKTIQQPENAENNFLFI